MEDDLEKQWKQIFAQQSEPYWDALLRFAFSLCKNQEKAEDLLQAALLRGVRFFQKFSESHLDATLPPEAVSKLREPEKAKHFKNWMYKILRNVYLDDLATGKRWDYQWEEDLTEVPQSDTNSLFGAAGSASSAAPQAVALAPEDLQNSELLKKAQEQFYSLAAEDALLHQINQLSDRQRTVLYLVAEDYSYKEVASILGVPIGTVMSTLSRGLAKLKSLPSLGSALEVSRSGATPSSEGIFLTPSPVTLLESTGERKRSGANSERNNRRDVEG